MFSRKRGLHHCPLLFRAYVKKNWAMMLMLFIALSHICREKEMATHSSTLAWKIPWMEKPGRLQSMGSQRVRHN